MMLLFTRVCRLHTVDSSRIIRFLFCQYNTDRYAARDFSVESNSRSELDTTSGQPPFRCIWTFLYVPAPRVVLVIERAGKRLLTARLCVSLIVQLFCSKQSPSIYGLWFKVSLAFVLHHAIQKTLKTAAAGTAE